MKNNPDIDAVSIDLPVKAMGDAKGWGASFMGLDTELSVSSGGADVTVAVLDTGIQRNHEIFKGKTILPGKDIVNGDNNPSDDHGHGTKVSGIIAESTSANVRIMPIKESGAQLRT